MSVIINDEEFDRIFDRIIYPEKILMSMVHLTEADRNYFLGKFLSENCYEVMYEDQLFYVLIDAKKDIFNH